MCKNIQEGPQKTEEELILEIRSLFEQLKEEEKGKIASGGYIIEPDNYTYTQLAKELINKAHELTKLNSKYDASGLPSVLNREVKHVASHKFEYNKNKKVKAESLNELKKRMRDATFHIRLYFLDVLGDIEL